MRNLCLLFVSAAALAGCATQPPQPRTIEAEQRLQSLLAGKVAGAPRSCLPPHLSSNMMVVDRHTILFRDGSRTWRSDLRGGCGLLGSSNYVIVTRGLGFEGLCSGQVARLADPSTGMIVGSCVWGDFVPYTRPGG